MPHSEEGGTGLLLGMSSRSKAVTLPLFSSVFAVSHRTAWLHTRVKRSPVAQAVSADANGMAWPRRGALQRRGSWCL